MDNETIADAKEWFKHFLERNIYMKDMVFVKKILEDIASRYGVRKLYIFGSYAKGTANEDSDIDILIEKGRPLSLLALSSMRQDIQEALGISVDIVTTAGIEEAFREAIAGSEMLIYEG